MTTAVAHVEQIAAELDALEVDVRAAIWSALSHHPRALDAVRAALVAERDRARAEGEIDGDDREDDALDPYAGSDAWGGGR